jgi:hypothetical protein
MEVPANRPGFGFIAMMARGLKYSHAYPLALRPLPLLAAVAAVRHDFPQKRLRLLRIDSGDDSFMRTKIKTPTLAQTARIRTSTPGTSTPKLQYPKPQHPNFNSQNLDTQISKPGIHNHKEVCF